MKKILIAAAALFLSHAPALAQSGCPSIVYGAVLTAAQWNACFAAKNNTLGYTPLNVAGGTMSGRLVTAASTTSAAGFNMTPGAAPTSPVNGDTWVTSAGMFYRANGVTFGPLIGSGSGSFAATAPLAVSFPAGVTTYAFDFSVANSFLATQTFRTILAGTTNTYDVGTSATVAAFRTIYAGTSFVGPVGTFTASVAAGGCTIGSNGFCVTGTASFSSTIIGPNSQSAPVFTFAGSSGNGIYSDGSGDVHIQGAFGGGVIIGAGTGAAANVAKANTNGTFSIFGNLVAASSSVNVGWSSSTQINAPSDGVLTIGNNAGTSFSRLQFGGTTASFPAIKRNSASLDIRLADDSGYADFNASNIAASGSLTAGVYVRLSSGNSVVTSPSSGVILLQDSAATNFGRLQFGGTTSSFPAIKRNGAAIDVRLADDSGYADVTGRQLIATNTLWVGNSQNTALLGPSSGVLTLQNNAGTDFGRLQFGGTTSSFAALRSVSAVLESILADASAYASFNAATITGLKGTAIAAGGSSAPALAVSSTANFGVFFGSGAPTTSGARGSIYLESATGVPYYNNNGSTGWTALQAAGSYITSLTGDVTGTGPGATATTLASSISGAKAFTTSVAVGGCTIGTDKFCVTGTSSFSNSVTLGSQISVTTTANLNYLTAVSAGGAVNTGLYLYSTNLNVSGGSGAPTVTEIQGSLYLRTDGSVGTRAYINSSSGSGATWVALADVNVTTLSSLTTVGTLGGGSASTGFTIAGASVTWSSQIAGANVVVAGNASGSPSATFGVVKCDGTTIVCSSGTISAVGAVASSIGVGSTSVTSGTAGRVLFDNGTLGEYTISGTGSVAMTASPTFTGTLTAASVSVTNGLSLTSSQLIMSGGFSTTTWTTSGARVKLAAASYTDTTSTGTVAAAYTDLFGASTILASSSTTYTNYFGAYFQDPAASTNVTMTNKWALGADSAKFGTSNQLTISTAGLVTIPGTTNHTGAFQINGNPMTFPAAAATIPQTIASGAKALATSAIASAACSSAQTDTATGAATTDAAEFAFAADPTAVTGYVPLTTGMLTIIAYPTSNTINFKVCNNTGSSITPGAVTINWRVVR